MSIKFNFNNFKPKTNYVIDASAGTGKTFNIIEIVKKLVNEYKYNLNEILIVTYTEKAAGELKDRLRKGLGNKYIENCPVYTIHSFCKSVINEFGVSSNMPLNLSLVGDDIFTKFVNEYIRKGDILNDIITIQRKYEINLDDLITGFSNAFSKYYLDKNFNEVNSIIKIANPYNLCSYVEVIDKIENKCDFEDLYSSITDLEYYFNSFTSKKGIEFQEEIIRTFSDYFNFDGKKFKALSFKSSVNEIDAFNFFKELKDSFKNFNEIGYIVLKYLKDLYEKYTEYKKNQSYQTFDDMIRQVRECTIDDSKDLKSKLQQKYKYGIIDEFQDTNQLQYDIFSKVFLSENHNIIVVGDPKQSIYSFQGADINVYLKAKEDIISKGGLDCVLEKNYRSSKDMVLSCNRLFQYFEFAGTKFLESKYCNLKEDGKEYRCEFDGEPVKSLWISHPADPKDYAKSVVSKIVEFCQKVNGKTRLQITDKKSPTYELRDVSFKDFAVLYRNRSDAKNIIYQLKRLGIPYIRYKDMGLFYGEECADWIALFEALDASDFTGNNRNKFRKVLFTNFFNKSINEISKDEYNSNSNIEFNTIINWKYLADSKRWEDLINDVIANSKLTDALSSLSKLNSLGIYKQIGSYCNDYLSNNHNIHDLINKLKELQKSDDDEEEGTGIIEKSTDFNAVKLMTMHASKGLQFPIVICCGGFKLKNDNKKTFYTYTEKDNKYLTSIRNSLVKDDMKKEALRLFYVAYTRSEFILMMEVPKEGDFIEYGNNFINENEDKNEYGILQSTSYNTSLKSVVQDILSKNETIQDPNDSKEKQEELLKDLIKIGKNKKSYKHSYSSLSHSKQEEVDEDNKEGEKCTGLSKYDKKSIYENKYLDSSVESLQIPNRFPKGANIGTCLHEIFEKVNFVEYDNKIDNLIEQSFNNYCIKNDCSYMKYVKDIVINTINAKLQVIHGNKFLDEYIQLKTIDFNNRKSEIEFNFNLNNQKLKNYCNGFIDLLFKQDEYYSIVDWKSDYLNNDLDNLGTNIYASMEELRDHVNNSYSIQRVLYAYTLIKWLKSYYTNESYEDIFNNHFGGIYYIFIRGCNQETGNGIYCQTWNSFSNLEEAFKQIMKVIKE